MSFFDKVREMLGGVGHKPRHTSNQNMGTPRGQTQQGQTRTQSTGTQSGQKHEGMREKLEDAVKSGIDTAARKADQMTGGKYHDKINKGANAARNAADKIDGKPD
ncbi:antitoxin [Acrocarpospora catenulata]|uniref:antitoxin n=1 Tax=Acrocarpospora catenulata TaxID=2836182 RepID=UPI001BD9FE52|nr:antitoxin [Acrocarpospora catenulata]